MQELSPSAFESVRPLFDPIRDMRAAVFTVLEGKQTGRVWVDQIAHPRSTVLKLDFYYLTSTPDAAEFPADTVKWLRDEVLNRQEYTGIWSFSKPWDAALQTSLQAYEVGRYVRSTFDFDAQRYRERHTGWQKRVPAGFAVQRLNAQTTLQADGTAAIWGSVENFLEHGFGFCMLDESQKDERLAFAANAQTVFVGDCHAETGVETREAYRRKGLATAVCCAYIDVCLEKGIYPEWGCEANNKPSARLARTLGYTNEHEFPFLYVHTPEHLRVK
jgi:RimJ/RimL family protein N-acetyltransferase